jgi:molecular chaperone HscA
MPISKEVAAALIDSLLTRLGSRPLEGPINIDITPQEYEALRLTLRPTDAPYPGTRSSQQSSKPAINWDSYRVVPSKTHRLCIDFGTAFSKVCVIGNDDRYVKPLRIGELAKHDNPLLVPSSVLVHEGRLYFGPDAIRRSQAQQISHRRIDALKQYLSKEEVTDIDTRPLEAEFADAPNWLTKGAVLRLYCSYLTGLAEAAASHLSLGFSAAQLPRRFARPAWDEQRGAAAEQFMRRMLADCRVVADLLKGRWTDGIELEHARAVLDAVRERPEDSYEPSVVLGSVLEATAAANAVTGGFEEFEGRSLLAVVDVGAGTTDFGVFALRRGKDDEMRVWELARGSQVLRQAGDTLDDVLASMIQAKVGAKPGSDIERRSKAKIHNERRFLKEQLFAVGEAVHRTDEDEEVRITLQEFIGEPQVKRFSEELGRKFQESLSAVNADNVRESAGRVVNVVLTGGGANLPMVRSLLEPTSGRPPCKEFRVDETDLLAIDRELPAVFPQMAVALGGAMEFVPEQRASLDDLGAGARQTVHYKSFA